jgi:hypothetical protein
MRHTSCAAGYGGGRGSVKSSEAVAAKVHAIDTEAALNALLERVLQAHTLAGMGL